MALAAEVPRLTGYGQLRHIYRRGIDIEAPSGIRYITIKGTVFEPMTQEDYEWLLRVRARSCGCGAKPRADGNGVACYEIAG